MRALMIPLGAVLLGLLAADDAVAAPRLLAVLPLDSRNATTRMDDSARASLEDLLRDEAANALTSLGWSVLTGENTYALLRDNGVDPAECGNGECHVATARELNVEMFISGVVHLVDGELVASIRLMETRTGRILASERLEGTNTLALRRAFEERATRFFTRAGLMAPAANVANAWLQLRVTPPDATVTVDGRPSASGRQGPFTVGSHTVRAEAPGYTPVEKSVELRAGAASELALELVAQPGRLRITTNVDAECDAGGAKTKLAASHPVTMELAVGNTRVTCSSKGHETIVRDVTVAPGGEVTIALTLNAAPKPVEQIDFSPPLTSMEPSLSIVVKPASSRRTWGWVALGAAAVVTAASVVFDTKAPSSNDRRLDAIDFLPVAGYAAALGLGGIGIYNLGAR